MTTEYSNWLVDKIADRKLRWLLWESSFSEITRKDMMIITMNLKEGTRMTKYLAQRKSMVNLKRKDWRQIVLIFGFEHVYLEDDVKTLMFRNYLGFASLGFCLRCRLLVFFFFFFLVWFGSGFGFFRFGFLDFV